MLAPWYEGRRHSGWRPLRPSQHLHDSPTATVARARRQCGWRRHVGVRRQPLWRPKKDHFRFKFFQESIYKISFQKGSKCKNFSVYVHRVARLAASQGGFELCRQLQLCGLKSCLCGGWLPALHAGRSLRRATARVEALAACAVIAHASAGMVACGDRGACSHVYICTQERIHK